MAQSLSLDANVGRAPGHASGNPVVRLYDAIFHQVDLLQPAALLLIRVYFGWQSYVSGVAHLTHIEATSSFFQSLGIPHPTLNVYISGGTELFGGLLLMFGLFSRLISVALVGNFLVAILAANPDARHLLKDSGPFVSDTAFPFFFASGLIFFFGAGKFSLDYIVVRPLVRRVLR